jgi:hypothetical protein
MCAMLSWRRRHPCHRARTSEWGAEQRGKGLAGHWVGLLLLPLLHK